MQVSKFPACTIRIKDGSGNSVYTDYCIGLSRYIAITNLPIRPIAVFVEYLRQFLIDLN